VLTEVLNGLQLSDGNVKKILYLVEENLQEPPNFSKTEQTMVEDINFMKFLTLF
jgi:hypothetical protein